MAGKWDQVVQSEKFQGLDATQRQAVRGAFFDREIRPNAPADKLETLRGAFFTRTEPDVFGQRESESEGVGAMDYAKELGAGLNEGTGSVLQGVGDLVEQGGQWVDRGLRAIGLGDALDAGDKALGGRSISEAARGAGEWFGEGGEAMRATQSEAAKQARTDSTPQGDITKPSTWSMGDDPSVAGYGLQISNLIGQFAPQAAALLTPGGAARAVGMASVGGLQAGGAAGEDAEQYVMQQSAEDLAKNSGMYRDLVGQGVEPGEAKRQTAVAARGAAFSGAAPVGGAGGALTHYILGPFQRAIGGGVGRRLGYGLAVDAPAEGAQEVAETVAGRMAQNDATQGNRDTTEGTFGDAALGAIAGGGHAALGAAMGERLPQRNRMPTPDEMVRERKPEDIAEAEQQYQSDRDDEAQAFVDRRRAEEQSAAAAREQFGETGEAIWQNADNDLPVTVRGIEPEPDESGRYYARVERDGQESFVPLDELQAVESSSPQAEGATPSPRQRTLGIDNDIRVAEQVGADEDAARLRNAKNLFIRAMQADEAGNGSMASRLRQRGIRIHQDIYGDPETAMPERPASFPVPYEFTGEVEPVARPPAASQAARQAATYDGSPDPHLNRPAQRLRQGDQASGESLIYGSGPVQRRGNANTGMDQAFENARSSDTSELGGQLAEAADLTDISPSPAQAEAGNYRKGRVQLHGLNIAIENPQGSTRRGTADDGTKWESQMAHHYGDIKRTTGNDGDNVDVFIGDNPESDRAFIVDQVDPDGNFDEHKVMLGFDDAEQARQGYRANYDQDWQGDGGVTEVDVPELKRWLKDGDMSKPYQQAQQELTQAPDSDAAPSLASERSSTPVAGTVQPEKIDDFGEKLEGARKDYASRVRDILDTEIGADTKASDVFPKLDYQKLIDAGMPKDSAAFIAVLRSSIPPKPRKGFKLKRWVQALDSAREIGQSVMDGNITAEQLFDQVSDGSQSPAWESQALTARMISGLDPSQFDQAAKWKIDARAGYSMFRGENVSPSQKFYQLQDSKGRTTGVWSDSFAGIEKAARDAVSEHLEKSADTAPRSRQTKINVYRDRRDGDRFIAFKNGSRVVRIRGGFASLAEASDYIQNNRDSLQVQIDEMRRGPEMRNKTNAERMGDPLRDGDVSPDQFGESFGFRGVQFGNYVEGPRRQRDLNDAHDALMDLADTLGIPPKGISLNGTLGLAFGARGKGGKQPAMAHYEPGQIVINLTKGKGAGSLAHEWFHALDNYIPDGQGRDVFQSNLGTDSAARAALAMRWSEMRKTLRDSGFQRRSERLDDARSKPYFGTPIEMAARAFEAYIKQRLGERGVRNDYLVNTREDSEAYPTDTEMESITPAFDRLIGTLDHESTDRGTRIYSLHRSPAGGESPSAETVRNTLDGLKEQLGDFDVVDSTSDLPIKMQLAMAIDGVDASDVRGFYDGDRLYIIASNNESIQRAVMTAVHEAVGHKGIRGVLGDEIQPVMRQLYNSLPFSKKGREALNEVLENYPFLDRNNPDHQVTIAEEMVAHLLEKGARPKIWQRAVAAIRSLLRRRFPSVAWTYTDVLALGERSRDYLGKQQDGSSDSISYSLRPKRQPTADQFNDLSDDQKDFMAKFGSKTPARRAMDWYRDLAHRAGLRIRQGMVDQYAALKELDEKRFGKDGALKESITSSSWVLARMSNAANGALHAMLHNGRIALDPDQKVIDVRDDDSKGLGAVLGRLGSPAEIERFMMWIAANRSDKLKDEGREFLFTDAEIRAGMQLNRNRMDDGRDRATVYEEVFKEFQQYRDDVLAIAEQSGIIRPDQRAMWRDEFYVPFYRLKDDKDVNVQLGTSGLSRQQAYKRLKGGTDNINDLLQNTMMNFHHLLDASLKNQAARQAIQNAEAMGMAHVVPESNRDTAKSTFVMQDGVKRFYEIDDPMVYQAMSALAHPGMNNTIMKVMRGFKRVFTNMTTTTPQFMAANLMRDTMQAVATNEVSANVFKNIYEGAGTLRDQRKRARMLAAGGSFNFGHLYSNNPDELRAQLTRNLRDAKVIGVPGSGMRGFAAPAQLIRAGWAKWGDMNDFAENLNRAAIYDQNQDKGKLKAAFEARDLIDFSARGAWPAVRILTDIVPFLNARIQGLDKIYRSGVKPGANVLKAAMTRGDATVSDKQAAARFWSVAGAVTLATVALYLNNHDDEDYQKLEEWQKDTYWHFFVGGQHFIIPKPFEVGAIATMAERMTQQFVDDEATGSLFAQRMGHMLTGTFAFSPVPQMMQPALDVYANRDSFTDRPIEGMGDQRLSPELRKRDSTSRVAQGASWLLNNTLGAIGNPETNPAALSPLQVDYLIQGYLGQVGAWAAGSVDVAWNTFDGKDEPARRWYEYQPVRRFYSNLGDEPRYTRYGTVFYEGLREAERAYSDVKELGELGRIEEARELAKSKADLLRLRKPLMGAQRKLNSVRKQIDAVRRSDLGGELKRQRIDRLTAVKNRIQQVLGEKVLEQRVAE